MTKGMRFVARIVGTPNVYCDPSGALSVGVPALLLPTAEQSEVGFEPTLVGLHLIDRVPEVGEQMVVLYSPDFVTHHGHASAGGYWLPSESLSVDAPGTLIDYPWVP